MISYRKILLTISVILLSVGSVEAKICYIAGAVTDTSGAPVIGATVMVIADTGMIKGVASDRWGRFVLKLRGFDGGSVRLRVSTVGYQSFEEVVSLMADTARVTVALAPAEVVVGGVEVRPERESGAPAARMEEREVTEAARASFVASNPISAVKEPQVIREGSSHSARLRVSGTSPTYGVNGIGIGRNPNHYGMFAVIPAAVVARMEVHTLGTGAAYDAPAAIAFETGRPFGRHADAELGLSAIEGTGSWSLGGERWFTLGAVRKSILDEIVKRVDMETGRRTVPPTNFQDVVVSSGVRLGSGMFLTVDQYHVRDALEYKTTGTSLNALGANTALATSEHYVGARLEMLRPGALIRLKGAVQSSEERYAAEPATAAQAATEPILDLQASGIATTLGADVMLTLGKCELAVGDRVRQVMKQRIDLVQQDWNFLPPDAASDNPHIYQPELNELYGSYNGTRRRTDHAAYASLRWSLGGVRMESGVRAGHYGALADGEWTVFRQSVTVGLGDSRRVTVFAGTFAEDPARRVLEAYQPLVHMDYNGLEPIRTALVSAQYVQGPVTVSAYRKRITQLPVLKPDFSRVDDDGSVAEGFLRTRSTGRADFVGGDVAVAFEGLMDGKLGVDASYGYSRATKTTSGVTAAYELNAPHRLYGRARYQVSGVVKLGAELAVRSGYAYTPVPGSLDEYGADRYSEDYYRASLRAENGARFPMHATLNLSASFDFGATEVYCSVANITNRGNAIISGADGYVYDAGILPSVGLTVGW